MLARDELIGRTDPLALVRKDSTYVYYIGQGPYVEVDPEGDAAQTPTGERSA
ncbi:hypothetical protein ACO2JO_05885 [Leptospira interrogans]